MKGIILAGGSGTRLFPLSNVASKQLMPVYDKPMIYYPLSTLMQMGIKDILIISTTKDISNFQSLFGDGNKLGLSFTYAIQKKPNGIAESFIIGEKFIGNDPVTLILGDNLFYGYGYLDDIKQKYSSINGAIIFGYPVSDPERYGVVEFDSNNTVISIEEKPHNPRSNYAIPGLYIYDNNVTEIVKNLRPSSRGELEITDLNIEYLKRNKLFVQIINRGVAWLDTGTHKSLLDAGMFIETVESRQGLKIGCIEEVAYNNNYISKDQLSNLIESYPVNSYTEYLKKIISE